jgi:NADPH:quinone reductase-like Zn-dependent oxidoreductase
VGGLAMQFAKAKGAYVIGTASAGELDYLRQLGADEVLDYRSQKVEEVVRDVDVVLEASSVRDNAERVKAISVLKKSGIFVSVNTDFPFDEAVHTALAKQQATGELSANQPRHAWLAEMAQLIDAGRVQVRVGQVFPLAQVADAHRASQAGHVRGKVVLAVLKDDRA